MQYQFNQFKVNTASFTLLDGSTSVHIEPLTLRLLIYLIENHHRYVPRAELTQALWKSRIVSNDSLNNEITQLRKRLGDNGVEQHTIRTIRGVGYQFVQTLDKRSDAQLTESKDPKNRYLIDLPKRQNLIGRHESLELLLSSVNSHSLISIVGPGGIGKTSLASELTHEIKREQKTAFVSLKNVSTFEMLIERLNDRLHLNVQKPATGLSEPENLLLGGLFGRAICNNIDLLVLDNVEQLEGISDFLVGLLEENKKIVCLCTSRISINYEPQYHLSLSGLNTQANNFDSPNRSDASQLFLELCDASDIQYDAKEIDFINDICLRLGGSPHAIKIAQTWLRTLSIQDLSEKIKEGAYWLSSLEEVNSGKNQSFLALYRQTFEVIPENLLKGFAQLCILPGGFSFSYADVLLKGQHLDLAEFIKLGLVTRLPNNRYEIHELTRQYAIQSHSLSLNQNAIVENAIKYYLSLLNDIYEENQTGNFSRNAGLVNDTENLYFIRDHLIQQERFTDLLFYWRLTIGPNPLSDLDALRACLGAYKAINDIYFEALNCYVELCQTTQHYVVADANYFSDYLDYISTSTDIVEKAIAYATLFEFTADTQGETSSDAQSYLDLANNTFASLLGNSQSIEKIIQFEPLRIATDCAIWSNRTAEAIEYSYALEPLARKADNPAYESTMYWCKARALMLAGHAQEALANTVKCFHIDKSLYAISIFGGRLAGFSTIAKMLGANEEGVRMWGRAQMFMERSTGSPVSPESFCELSAFKELKENFGTVKFWSLWNEGKAESSSEAISNIELFIDTHLDHSALSAF